MTQFKPYKDPAKSGRWTIDTDPDDKLNYLGVVTQWMMDNNTMGESYTVKSKGVTLLKQDPITGSLGDLCPVRLQVTFMDGDQPVAEPYLTFHVKTVDGQEFDKSIWFKKVEN